MTTKKSFQTVHKSKYILPLYIQQKENKQLLSCSLGRGHFESIPETVYFLTGIPQFVMFRKINNTPKPKDKRKKSC